MKTIYFFLFILVSFISNNSNGQSITLLGGTEFLSIDSLSFAYENPGFDSTDWIGIYPSDVKPGDVTSTAWMYVQSEADTAVIKDYIPGGEYRAYLLCCDGYEVKDSTVVFTILEPKLSASSPSYLSGDTMTFTFESPMFSSTDWIGIYKDDTIPPGEGGPSIDYKYIPSESGSIKFTTVLTPGNYVAYLLCCDGYRVLANTSFTIEDPNTAFVRPVKNAFGPTDEIAFDFNNPEYENTDWIGVYYVGDDPNTTPAIAWKYVTSTKGTLVLDDVLPAGSFEAYLFCCDVSDIVLAKSEVFTSAGGAASSYIRTSASVYPENYAIAVNYRSSGFSATDWIGIYNDNGVVPGSTNPALDWKYAPADSGTINFTTVLIPGDYVVYLLCCDGYEVKAKYKFKIADASTPVLLLSALTYEQGDSLVFTYSAPDFTSTDWIGVYNPADVPGDIGSIYWDYITGTSGTMKFLADYEVGEYWAGLFCCDGYELLARTSFSVIEGTSVYAKNIASNENLITVFPNPSNGLITLLSRGNSSISNIEVFNIAGRLMYKNEFTNPSAQRNIDLSSLNAGVYILKAKANDYTFTAKIILQ